MPSTGDRPYQAMLQHRNVLFLLVLTLSVVLQDCCVSSLTTFGKTVRTGDSTLPSAKRQKTGHNKVMEPAFANAGQEAGLQIWRVEVRLLIREVYFIALIENYLIS